MLHTVGTVPDVGVQNVAVVVYNMYLQGGALNRGLKWFFSKNRPSSLIEAFGSPEKGWLVCADLLRTELFDIAAIFCRDGLQAAAERAAGPADVGRRHPVPLLGDRQA